MKYVETFSICIYQDILNTDIQTGTPRDIENLQGAIQKKFNRIAII
jgi:hypothetical protein